LILFRGHISISYDVFTKSFSIKINKSFEDRAIKTMELLMCAIEKAIPQIKKSFHISVRCSDYVSGDKMVWAYCKSNTQRNVILLPDFSFVNWKETGMDDYEKTCLQISEAGKNSYPFDKVFWIGNVKTHISRQYLCDLAAIDSRIEAIGMNWSSNKSIGCSQKADKYVSLVDHTKYRYLIDVQGRGWSARTKVLFFSHRPVFLVDRKYKEYWYEWIEPYYHYIPVKEDLSDLVKQIDWAETHPTECQMIADNAYLFAIENLTREAAIKYLSNLLITKTQE